MRIRKPNENILFQTALNDLKDKDVTLTPDEVVWLYQTAERAMNRHSRELPRFVDVPVVAHGITFWPLSLRAYFWLQDVASAWYEGTVMEVPALGFAMAHSKDIGIFNELTTKAKTTAKILAWFSLGAGLLTIKELAHVVDMVSEQKQYYDISTPNAVKKDAASSTNWSECIAIVSGCYHIDPERVLSLSADAFDDLLRNAHTPFGGGKDSNQQSAEYKEFCEVVLHLKRLRNPK
jgi:hypothetical protein